MSAAEPRRRRLLDELQNVSLLISTVVIVVVQIALLAATSAFQRADLVRDSTATADETALLLGEPLYNLDDSQASRIGEALIASGRIAGITIESVASGILFDRHTSPESSSIPGLSREVEYKGLPLGSISLSFSDYDMVMTRRRLAIVATLIIAAVIVGNLLVNNRIVKKRMAAPVSAIVRAIDAVAAGRYDIELAETGYSDVDSIVTVINDMAHKVRKKNEELKALNDTLEHRVEERTAELKRSLENLSLAQDSLMESSRLAALGHLSAGVAHELNTPLAAIISSVSGLVDYLESAPAGRAGRCRGLDDGQLGLYSALVSMASAGCVDLEEAREGPGDRERLRAALSAAGVPDRDAVADLLADIGLAGRLAEIVEELKAPGAAEALKIAAEDLGARRIAEVINVSARKATRVVAALRSYLSPEEDDFSQPVDLDLELDKVLVLMQSVLKHGITIRREYSGPRALGSPERLAQVWMNLIRNAAQAMEYSGTLTLRTSARGGEAVVSVIDEGPGIPEEAADKIFEPFYTTKKHGEGMGMGLVICSKIIESHGGGLSVASRPGHTEFTVTLPLA